MAGGDFRTGRFARLGKLGAAALGASSRYLGDRVVDAVRQAEARQQAQSDRLTSAGARLAETMGELKGAAMKLGQMLSIDNEVLPPEMRKALAVLQRQAPPMPFSQVKSLVEERLGEPIDAVFLELEEQVLGAASLGQVHGGTLLDGRRVAVKVQYPGIAGTIRSDMSNLRAVLKLTPIPGLKGRVDDYIAEISDVFAGEADYLREANHLTIFGGFAETIDEVVIPKPVLELCRSDLLVMDRLDGRLLKDAWESMTPDECDAMGARFVEFFAQTFHHHHWIYGDPHPGNFLCLDSGELGILDFGCARQIEASRTHGYLRLLQAMWTNDRQGLVDQYVELGFAGGEPVVAPDHLFEFNKIALAPFMVDEPFDWGAWSFRDQLQGFFIKHPELLRFSPPADDLLYLRMVSGLRGILHDGSVRLNVRARAERLVDDYLP